MEEKESKDIKPEEITKKSWWDDPYNKAIIIIIIIALIIRLYLFFSTLGQPVWWDEAGYLVKAQKIAFGWTWTDFWNPHKPILLSWIAVVFFKIGLGETALRFMIMLFSVAGVYLTFLIGKEFFNKRLALISAILAAVFWVSLFFTPRILTDLPAATLLLLTVYFFSKGYIKKENPKYLWLAGVFFSITFLMRVSVGIMIIPFLLYMVMEDKLKFLKNKNIWIAVGLMILVILPFIGWLYAEYPEDPIGEFIGTKHGRFSVESGATMGWKGIPAYIKDMPYVFGAVLAGQGGLTMLIKYIPVILLLFGLVLFFADIFIAPDLIFRKDNNAIRKKIFILVAIILPLINFGMTRAYVEQRDALYIVPFLFPILGIGLWKIKDALKKYGKYVGITVLVILLFFIVFYQVQWGFQLTEAKKTSYMPVKEAGVWISSVALPGDITYTESKPQHLYYSQHETRAFGSDVGYDPEGRGREEWEAEIEQTQPRFMIISAFEGNTATLCNPPWICDWLQENQPTGKVVPVRAWFMDPEQQQPLLIIYEFANWTS